jgi:hypothetical protein
VNAVLTLTERIDRAEMRKLLFESLTEGEKRAFAQVLVGASYLSPEPFDIAMSYVREARARRSAV